MKKIALITITLILSINLASGLELAKVFTDNMVLQQNDTARFWGWGEAWKRIIITTSWGEADTVWSNGDKNWKAKVKTPTGSFEKHTITIQEFGINKDYSININKELGKVEFKNVLIGEVWLCSGQSNMQWNANAGIVSGETEIPAANYPSIRFFEVKKRISDYPQDDVAGGKWTECTPETMRAFSSVGYFFGKSLHEKLNIPVGLISDSWGGIPIDVAYPAEAVEDIPELFESSKGNNWYGAPFRLGTLYNGMTHPLHNYPIAGMIWYQGEGNTGVDPGLYAQKQEILIKERRKQFGENLPFYYVQIAPFKYDKKEPIGAIVRDQQRLAAQIKNSEMVVVSNVGDTTNIHPRNKLPVGERLANLAFKYHYKITGELVESPLFKKAYMENNKVFVEFSFSEGLHFKEGDKGYFELAGADENFISVAANANGNIISLDSNKVPNPKYVRFAFSDIATPLLLNRANLPASCFASQLIEEID